MSKPRTVTSKEQAERIVREHYPHAKEITFIEHGFSNLIARIDGQVIFRFPRDEKRAERCIFEMSLLQRLEGALSPIPTVIQMHRDPVYAITSRLPGNHLSARVMSTMPPSDQARIGRQLADFVYALEQAITPTEVHDLQQQTNVIHSLETWAQHLSNVFAKPQANGGLQRLVEEYYPQWQRLIIQEPMRLTVHGDLHESNLLFDGTTLTGVLDFEFTEVGSIEQEMRLFYPFGEGVLQAAVQRYFERSGVHANLEYIRLWIITTELATLCNRINLGDETHAAYVRARDHLRTWLPDFPL